MTTGLNYRELELIMNSNKNITAPGPSDNAFKVYSSILIERENTNSVSYKT